MRNGRHDPTPAEWAEAFRAKALSAYRVAAASAASHPNSAANRAYYAVHNAMNMRCGPVRRLPQDHGELTSPAVLAQVGLQPADATAIVALAMLRRMADYETRDVFPRSARTCVESAAGLLQRLGIEVPS